MNLSTASIHPLLDAAMWVFGVLLVIAFFLAATQYIEILLTKYNEYRLFGQEEERD